MKHLKIVLEILKQNALFAKMSKCIFGQNVLEYLGHIVSKEGVPIDPKKIQSMIEWPIPKNIK